MKNSKNNVTPTRTPPLFPVVKIRKRSNKKNKKQRLYNNTSMSFGEKEQALLFVSLALEYP